MTSNNPQSLNHLSTHATDNVKLQMILFQIWLSTAGNKSSVDGESLKKGQNLQMPTE
jgi:hypothetical protein